MKFMHSPRSLSTVVYLALIGLALARQEATPQLPAGPFDNEYVITARLDPAMQTIHGTARVTFRNSGSAPVAELPFHLYPNAWSSTETRWIRDARGERAIRGRGERGAGYLRIDSLKIDSGADLAASTTIDETVMRVTLPEPIAVGASIALVIEFETKLPRTIARMGQVGEHVDAMQWFPKLAGRMGDRFVDWPFREPSEFFANFGRYEVEITLPKRFEIEGTGQRVRDEVNEANDTKTVKFEAAGVHDFAWTADPNFIRQSTFTERGTQIVLLNQPFLEPKGQLVLDATRFALDRYAEWIFPYPYPRIVIDALPAGLGGGMEYPTLFTISARAPEFLAAIAARSESPAGVTIHEFGHQYWYGMVASNEFEEAWLDEGINTYMTGKIMEAMFPTKPTTPPLRGLPALLRKEVALPLLSDGGPLSIVAGYERSPFQREDLERPGRGGSSRKLFGFALPELRLNGERVDRFRDRMATYAPVADLTSLEQRSWETYPHYPRTSYTAAAYSKPTLMLRTLENWAGWDATQNLLQTYARRFAFRHPTTADFLSVAGERLTPEQVGFLKACITGSDTVDWAVESVRCDEIRKAAGFAPQKKPGDPMPADFSSQGSTPEASWFDRFSNRLLGAEVKPAPVEAKSYLGEIVVRNRGRLNVPTELELWFADGSRETRPIDASQYAGAAQPWIRIELEPRPVKLLAAVVDPQRKVALDLDLTNNARGALPDTESAVTLAAFCQYVVQTALCGLAWLS